VPLGSSGVPLPVWDPEEAVVVEEPVCKPTGRVVDEAVGLVVVVVGGGEELGMNIPSKCQRPVKLLKGPPTMALAQLRVKAPEEAL
jgi:hypothetical protein